MVADEKWAAGLRKGAARCVFGANAKAALTTPAGGHTQAQAQTQAQQPQQLHSAVAVADVGLSSVVLADGDTRTGVAAQLAAGALAAHVARAAEHGAAYDLVVASALQTPAAADAAEVDNADARVWLPLGRLLSDAWDVLPKRVLLLAVTVASELD